MPVFAEESGKEGSKETAKEPTPQEEKKSFWDQFKDPEDGKFDLTAGSEDASGFLPFALPFNDPSVGVGLAVALAYFHPKPDPIAGNESGDLSVPPSTTFGGGAITNNGTWAAAAGHMGVWKDGRVRYKGMLGFASVNLDFFGIGSSPGLNDNPISFNIEGGAIVQEVQYRLGNTHLFAGGRYVFLDTESTFDIMTQQIKVGKSTDAGLTALLTYDDRDNPFTPNAGTRAGLQVSRNAAALGGDFNYTADAISVFHYWPVFSDRLILGFRLDYQHAGDEAPFYALPWVKIRGIPAFRYLGNYVVTTEFEPRWKINERWSVLAFGGAGRAEQEFDLLDDAEKAYGYGAGFRYLLARKLGLAAGLDIAWGPEENVPYIIFGSAW